MQKIKTLLVIAGEASGDSLGASVVKALMKRGGWRVVGVGGVELEEAGVRLVGRAEALGVMGLVEVVPALPRIWGVWRAIMGEVEREKPDAALLIDMPDFNMRLGPKLAAMGVKVAYVGAPQAWAWRRGRAATMGAWVGVLGCLFPFEEEFYRGVGVNARFVGHPKAEAAKEVLARRSAPKEGDAPRVVVMPGSRRGELSKHLPILDEVMNGLLARHPGLEVRVPVARTLRAEEVEEGLTRVKGRVKLCGGEEALDALAGATVAIIASGTATTEAALVGAPMVVVYRVARLTYEVAKRLIRVPWVAMPNLLAGRQVVPELLQGAMTAQGVLREVEGLIGDVGRREEMRRALLDAGSRLDAGAPFGEAVAEEITRLVGR
jgi:lipid-A-disaccharide synthase